MVGDWGLIEGLPGFFDNGEDPGPPMRVAPDPTRTLANRQMNESSQILMTCTADTPRALVAWAAGVRVAQHASQFYRVPVEPRTFAPLGSSGGFRTGNRRYDAKPAGFTLTDCAEETGWQSQQLLRVRWEEVAALVRPELVEHLRPRIRSALKTRRERIIKSDPTRPTSYWRSEEHRRSEALWREIEDECRELGALVWQACRPGDDGELPECTLAGRQLGEAITILGACDESTPRELVLWAIGVREAQHCMHPVQWFAREDLDVTSNHGSVTVGTKPWRELTYHHKKGAAVRERVGGEWREVVSVKWPEFKTIMRRGLVPDGLLRQAEDTLRERRAATRGADYMLEHHTYTHAERVTQSEAWVAMEERCEDIGARIWEALRPCPQPVQLELFELMGGTR